MSRQRLIQLLRASVACSYCLGWGKIWFRGQTNQIEVPPRWGYSGWPMKALGCIDVAGKGVVDCAICRGTGENR